MDATIESDTTSQNTNSLISSGYFIENYSENDKENNSTNNIDAILESSEDQHWHSEQMASRLYHFHRETNSLPLSVPLTTKIISLSIAFC